jgi:hypothetical protein
LYIEGSAAEYFAKPANPPFCKLEGLLKINAIKGMFAKKFFLILTI